MSADRLPEKLLTIFTPVACTECGETMPAGTVAWIPGWGQIAHWYSVGGCSAYEEEDDDWDDDEEDDL
ncbi:hypothetical protein [Brachybacterium massiliense]|uniref:hypothetical protein n=1 Tax=Brachybacterium massiliense TaxID=1755098 RepID=UPI000B3BC63F|nr:hypothetical protein [Brachybacterium massiliense]